jgi:hypothetical protein
LSELSFFGERERVCVLLAGRNQWKRTVLLLLLPGNESPGNGFFCSLLSVDLLQVSL